MTLHLAASPLSGRIYAGRWNKAGNGFREPRYDVTSDALKAVVDKIGPGNIATITENGKPLYEIAVRKLGD